MDTSARARLLGMGASARDALRERWHLAAAAAFGVSRFVWITDVHALDPRAMDGVRDGDFAYHTLGRIFAQWDGFHWPLARITNYLWPVGTSAVFTDANPWLTLLAKILLPADAPAIQLVGPWLALCYALQGVCGARLVARFTTDRLAAAMGGALFVLAPALAWRMPHDSLAAHWLVLLVIESVLRPAPRGDVAGARASRGAIAGAALACTVAAGVHPTLFAMVAPFAVVVLLRHAVGGGVRRGLLRAAAVAVPPALVLVAFGTLRGGVQRETGGFGLFSANVLALVDPFKPEWSVLPVLPHGAQQYEGFGFLGLGVLTLVVASLAAAKRPDRWTLAAAAVALAEAIFALSSRIEIGTHLVVDLSRAYEPLHAITNAFRSSGRFVWPLGYLLMALAVRATLRLSPRPSAPRAALAAALVLQLVDQRNVTLARLFTFDRPPSPPHPAWALTRGVYRHMNLDPPVIETNNVRCPGDHSAAGSWIALAFIASNERLTFDSGQVARLDEGATLRACDDVARARREGRFAADVVYVPAPDVAPAYRARPELVCASLDGREVCVLRDPPTAFSRALIAISGR